MLDAWRAGVAALRGPLVVGACIGCFVLGAITLALVFAWVMPFAGALMLGSAGTAVWMFLDATPANAWLAGAAYVAMGLTLARWVAESRQREA